jgi:Cu-Zn family superoxide dismutase
MKRLVRSAALVAAVVMGGGLAAAGKKAPKAAAGRVAEGAIAARSEAKLSGSARLVEKDGQVTLTITVENAPPGDHAVHFHEKGDCSSPDGKSAGGHWNPTTDEHGKWGAAHHHLGDIGNLTVGADGKGTITLTTDKWTLEPGKPNNPTGQSVIVHGGVDDFKTQPTGNAGNRIGCAVISAVETAAKKK